MQQSLFEKALLEPVTYGSDVTQVQLLQTHISYVALTDTYVYKIKKPVNFGFLDYSTLEKRKYFCDEEIRLNKRLCPEIYLDVVRLTKRKNGGLEINGAGLLVDYAIRMNQFSQKHIMTSLLKNKAITKEHIDALCDILVDFYHSSEGTDEIRSYGRLESVQQNIIENFEQTKDVIDRAIPKETYQFIKQSCEEFFIKHHELLTRRMKDGYIHDCHGDLHSGNIVVSENDDICVFDCIEFNKRFRFIDVASDIGFLAMDLDYHEHFALSSHLIRSYVKKSNDTTVFDVLNFYKSYRAYVRGKVMTFQLNDVHISHEKEHEVISIAQKYFDLSRYYAELFSVPMHRKRPILFLVSGLTGTGKSTLALQLSIDYHAEIINTDVIRKNMAGIDSYERHYEEPDTGLYDPQHVKKTYEKVIELARSFLLNNRCVVLDATFQRKEYRVMAQRLAKDVDAQLISILCVVPKHVAKKWLDKRMNEQSVSDGRWEIYLAMEKTFEPYDGSDSPLVIDMSKDTFEEQIGQFRMILSSLQQG